jgi:hypothetical protein
MGEYANYCGQRIKIGTCESMYYLRPDQAQKVEAEPHSVDPIRDAAHLLFRFPFPDEDHIAPGAFEHVERSVAVRGVLVPEGVEHGRVQFIAPGYNTMLPCPEGNEIRKLGDAGPTIHRNGFPGAVRIVQQRLWKGHLALVCACGGCKNHYRYPLLADAAPVVAACRAEAELQRVRDSLSAEWWNTVADRIVAGYTEPNLFTTTGGTA